MAPSGMALARALTRRTKRSLSHTSHGPARDGTVKYPAGTIKRELISLPTELISTTNVDALNAPDISTLSSSSSASIDSSHESNFSRISRDFIDSPMTTPDTSSVECSPVEPHSTRSFFDTLSNGAMKSSDARPSSSDSGFDAPAIPKRAPSHSKRAHQALARQRSVSRMSPPPLALGASAPVQSSVEAFSGPSDPNHPFSKELAQVNEVAEEFGLTPARLVEEERALVSKGLMKFSVDDYLQELCGGVYEDKLGFMANPWV